MKKIFFFWILSISLVGCQQKNTKPISNGNSEPELNSKGFPTTADWLPKKLDDYIEIDDKNVTKIDEHYLIDIPIKVDPEKTYIFFLNAKIPMNFFSESDQFYPEMKKFIIARPDWELYDKIAKGATAAGVNCAEPITTNYYFRITRNDDKTIVDTVHVSGDTIPVGLSFQFEQSNNFVPVYRTESYGSVCCPHDEMRALIPEDEPFMKKFQKEGNFKIAGTFQKIWGDEGEFTTYCTLPNLTNQQRLQFLIAKYQQWILHRDEIKVKLQPLLVAPQLVEKSRLSNAKEISY